VLREQRRVETDEGQRDSKCSDFIPREFRCHITGLNQQDAKLPANKRVGKPRDSKKVSEGCLPKQSRGWARCHETKERTMKTGRDANQSGLYVSECCMKEFYCSEGQMLPRCPRCSSLTVWELEEQETGDRNEKQLTRIA